jgi:transcriptional regulator with XRE-family HTH domain
MVKSIRERLKKRRDTSPGVSKQPRPKGLARPIDAAWKQAIRSELAARGMTRKELAKRCGVTPGAVTILLNPETKTCRFVDAILRVLEISPPEYLDARDAEVTADMRRLRMVDEAEYNRLASRARSAISRSPRKQRDDR